MKAESKRYIQWRGDSSKCCIITAGNVAGVCTAHPPQAIIPIGRSILFTTIIAEIEYTDACTLLMEEI